MRSSLIRYPLAALLTVLAAITGAGAAVAAFLGAATVTAALPILFLAALGACFLIALGVATAAAHMITSRHQGRKAIAAAAGITLLVVVVSSVTVLQPLPSTPTAHQAPQRPPGVRYWDLTTGSHIAYLRVPAVGAPKPAPIVFVGGGPGEEDVADASQVRFFSQLTRLGYDVYFYDQIGSGLSARLRDPRQYTLARHVVDLEAIRRRIGTRTMVLMGSSWGGELVANYMAAHPHSVARAIFTSPAPIDEAEWPSSGNTWDGLPAAEQRRDQQMLYTPRFIPSYELGSINPRAAMHLVSNREADAFFSAFVQQLGPGTVCDPTHLPRAPDRGFGFYDNIFTTKSAQARHPSPLPVLAHDKTPALILTGSCNYIPWAPTLQYHTTLPNSTLVCPPNTGHVIYLDQPRPYLATIRAFLIGAPLPVRAWTGGPPCPTR